MTVENGAERIAELEADNERLRRLLDQRDAPGELRHRLRSTLALLRTIIRESVQTERDLAGYSAHLEDRLDAIVRAQASADMHGEIDLSKLLADEFFHYGVSEGERLALKGPEIRLQPRASQIFALAFHELAVNAVEHGATGVSSGRVEIAWRVDPGQQEPMLSLSWTEFGSPQTVRSDHRGFGTEVLTRLLAYELKADTTLAVEPDGVRCSIRLPLPGRVGRIAKA